MKLTTWNVNGLRARLTHVIDFLREHEPDVLCLQETKVQDHQFPHEPLEDEGYNIEIYGQKSYNGVAILARHPIEDIVQGLPDDGPDAEKRVLGCIVGDLMVLDLYVPNGKDVDTESYRFKLDWFRRLRAFLDQKYSVEEKVALVGDFNVAMDDRDVYDPAAWKDGILCSRPEREAMHNLFEFGLVDLFREKCQEGGIYTWWNYKAGKAAKDEGLRIDYILSSPPLTKLCSEIVIHKEERLKRSPSDHAPVTAVFQD